MATDKKQKRLIPDLLAIDDELRQLEKQQSAVAVAEEAPAAAAEQARQTLRNIPEEMPLGQRILESLTGEEAAPVAARRAPFGRKAMGKAPAAAAVTDEGAGIIRTGVTQDRASDFIEAGKEFLGQGESLPDDEGAIPEVPDELIQEFMASAPTEFQQGPFVKLETPEKRQAFYRGLPEPTRAKVQSLDRERRALRLGQARAFARDQVPVVDTALSKAKPPTKMRVGPRMLPIPVEDAETTNFKRAKQMLQRVEAMDPENTGFWAGMERAAQEPAQLLPFIGSITKTGELLQVLSISRKEERGEKLSPGEEAVLNSYAAFFQAANNFTPGILDSAAQTALAIPAFALEFAATSGVYKAGQTAGRKGLEVALRKGMERLAERRLGQLAVKGAAAVAGGAAQAAVLPTFATETVRRQLPRMSLEQDKATGAVSRVLDGRGEDFMAALAKGYGSSAIEAISERTGGAVNLPVDWMKKQLLARFAKLKGLEMSSDAFRKLAERAGWNGIVGEIFEEQVAKPFRETMPEAGETRGYGERLGAQFSKEQLATEALGFAMFGGAAKALDYGVSAAGKAIESREKVAKATVPEVTAPKPTPAPTKTAKSAMADKTELLRRGLTPEEVNRMRPEQVQAELAKPVQTATPLQTPKQPGITEKVAKQGVPPPVLEATEKPVVTTKQPEAPEKAGGARPTITQPQETGTTEGAPPTPGAPSPSPSPDFKAIVEAAGGKFVGIQEGAGKVPEQVLFNVPESGATVSVASAGLTPARVKENLERKRAEFKAAETKGKPEDFKLTPPEPVEERFPPVAEVGVFDELRDEELVKQVKKATNPAAARAAIARIESDLEPLQERYEDIRARGLAAVEEHFSQDTLEEFNELSDQEKQEFINEALADDLTNIRAHKTAIQQLIAKLSGTPAPTAPRKAPFGKKLAKPARPTAGETEPAPEKEATYRGREELIRNLKAGDRITFRGTQDDPGPHTATIRALDKDSVSTDKGIIPHSGIVAKLEKPIRVPPAAPVTETKLFKRGDRVQFRSGKTVYTGTVDRDQTAADDDIDVKVDGPPGTPIAARKPGEIERIGADYLNVGPTAQPARTPAKAPFGKKPTVKSEPATEPEPSRHSYLDDLKESVNKMEWYHVPPRGGEAAYGERGKFLASRYEDAEFYGKPNLEPERVTVKNPLVGPDELVETILGVKGQREGDTYEEIIAADKRWKEAALAQGYDSIITMGKTDHVAFLKNGTIPASMELNVLEPGKEQPAVAEPAAKEPWQMTQKEWFNHKWAQISRKAQKSITAGESGFVSTASVRQQTDAEHRRNVERAIQEGNTVPPEVLAELNILEPPERDYIGGPDDLADITESMERVGITEHEGEEPPQSYLSDEMPQSREEAVEREREILADYDKARADTKTPHNQRVLMLSLPRMQRIYFHIALREQTSELANPEAQIRKGWVQGTAAIEQMSSSALMSSIFGVKIDERVFKENLRLADEWATRVRKSLGEDKIDRPRVAQIMDRFEKAMRANEMPTDPRAVRDLAKEVAGGDPAEYVDDIYDALEGATNRLLRDDLKPGMTLDMEVAAANRYEEALGRRTRTIEITKRQQFSTPLPIGMVVAYAGDAHPDDVVLEPTAGTGNLLVAYQSGPSSLRPLVRAIEIDRRRVDVLQANDVDVREADYIQTKLNDEAKPDVIVTNPPWGKITTGRYEKLDAPAPWGRYGDVSERFIVKNLKDLQEGGRVSALMPTTVLQPSSAGFRKWLRENHTVRAWIQSPPGAYTRRGTDVDSVLLVVDKGKVEGAPDPLYFVDKNAAKDYGEYVEQAAPLAEGGSHARIRTRPEPEQQPRPQTTPADQSISGPERTLPERTPGGTGLPERQPVRPSPGEFRPTEPGVGAAVVPEGTAGGRPAPEPAGAARLVRQGSRVVRPEGMAPARLAEFDEASNSPIFTPYGVRSGARGNPHPRQVVETRSLAGAPAPEITYKVSKGVQQAHRRKIISDEQVDMVAAIGHAADAGHGIMVADDVGLGKSREVAATWMDWRERGRAKRILITSKGEVNLRDLEQEMKVVFGVGPDEPLPFKYIYLRDFPQASGRSKKEYTPVPVFDDAVYVVEATNLTAYERAINELGFDGVLADEVHTYKNIGESKVAETWKKLHLNWMGRQVPIAYFSATPATMIEELEYLYGIKEWSLDGFGDWVMLRTGRTTEAELERLKKKQEQNAERIRAKTPEPSVGSDAEDSDRTKGGGGFFKSRDVFASGVSVAEMEQIVRELKMRGKYYARDLWRGGVEFDQVDEALTPEEEVRYAKAVGLLRDIEDAWWKFKRENSQMMGFGPSALLQFAVKRFQFDLRLRRAIRQAQAALARGEQPVISLINVNATKEGEGNVYAALNDINVRKVTVDEDTGEVFDMGEIPEALAVKNELMERARTEYPDLPDPIKLIQQSFGGENKVAVVTGEIPPRQRRREMEFFQAGDKKVAVISGAGKTGINLHHVTETKGGARGRRNLILADYEWSATNFKQELGRVDRSGQVSAPRVTMLTMGSAAERKFVSTIANRMKTLGAVSKGAGESATAEPLEHFEIGGDFDNFAMRETWRDLDQDQKMMFRGSKFLETQADGSKAPRHQIQGATVKDFMFQIQFMPVAEGNKIWDKFWENREHLLTGEHAAEREARKTQRGSGEITRTHELRPDLALHEIKDASNQRAGILVGMVTDKMSMIAPFITGEYGPPKREYVSFTDTKTGEQIAGLRIPVGKLKPLAKAFGTEVAYKHTAGTALDDLRAGDRVPVVRDWALRVGTGGQRTGYIVVEGAGLTNTERGKVFDLLNKEGKTVAYNPVSGGFFHLGKVDDTEAGTRIQRFLERFPIKTELAEQPATAEELTGPTGEGPGTPKKGQTDITGGPIKQLASSIETSRRLGRAPFGTRRVAKQAALDAKGNTARALVSMKDAVQKLWDLYSKPPKWNDFKELLGRYGYIEQKAAAETRQFVKAIKRAVPSAIQREGITNWIEAGGDTEKLNERMDSVPDRYRAGYQAALELTDEEITIARNIRNYQDERLERDIEAGLLEHGVEDYVHHVWKKPPGKTRTAQTEISIGKLQPNPSFVKERIFENFAEGEAAGYDPKTKDIAALVEIRERAANRALASRGFIRSLLDGKAQDGRPIATVSGGGVTLPGGAEPPEAYLIKPKTKPEDAGDYRPVDHPALRKWVWAARADEREVEKRSFDRETGEVETRTVIEGNPIYVQGDILIHPDHWKHVKNMLGSSAIRRSPFGKAVLRGIGTFKHVLLSFSAFHQVQEGLHAIFHRVNPFHPPQIDFDNAEQRELIEHGLMVASYDHMEAFSEGLYSTALTQKIPGIGPFLQKYGDWLFHDYIPRLKMALGREAFERNEKRYKGKLNRDQILEITANQANAAFGELNYDWMGRNRTTQDVLRLMFLAPDFLEARARFVGQSAKPYGAEQAVALYLVGALGMYIIFRILNKLLDDDYHLDRPFSLIVKGREFTPRTVPGDIYHLLKDQRNFVYHRLNPTLVRPGIELLTGRDALGRKRDVRQQLRDWLLGHVPIPLQALTDDRDRKIWESLLNSVGISAFEYRTAAQRRASELLRERLPAGQQTREQEEDNRLIRRFRDKAKEGALTKEDTQKLLAAIGPKRFANVIKGLGMTDLQRSFRGLTLEEALEVWEVANEKEQASLTPIMQKKALLPADLMPSDQPEVQRLYSEVQRIEQDPASAEPEKVGAYQEAAKEIAGLQQMMKVARADKNLSPPQKRARLNAIETLATRKARAVLTQWENQTRRRERVRARVPFGQKPAQEARP